MSLLEGVIETDLFVKPTDSHQYLQSSSCHPFHCKKGIPYSQALKLNRICSETKSFDKRCNDLEILSNQARNKKRFHEHYLQNEHNGICNWDITIIDHAETVKSLRQKELYWYHKLKTYAPFGLNERDVYAAY